MHLINARFSPIPRNILNAITLSAFKKDRKLRRFPHSKLFNQDSPSFPEKRHRLCCSC